MAHFAKVENGVVTQVIVVEQEVINSGLFGDPALWVQTSYNTRGGKHPENKPLRGNYAGIGYIYDKVNDIFYTPKPYPSWTLNVGTATWEPPAPMPEDGNVYKWEEATKSWVKVDPTTNP